MSRDVEKDISAISETEQLLFTDTCGASERLQRWSTDKSYLQDDASSSKSTSQDKSVSNHDAQIGETSNNPITVITLSSITVNDEDNDDPPPYSVIALPNHAGWPCGLFSFGNTYSTDEASYRMQIPLTPFQASLIPTTDFYSQGINGQHALLPMPMTPERFFKLRCDRNSFASDINNGIAEKIDDKKSRRYGAILVAAAVIIFLMVLSLMVRFIMERSWWRR